MRWKRNLRKFFALSGADRLLLIEAFYWLGVMRVAIGLVPFRQTAAWLGLKEGAVAAAGEPAQAVRAERIGWAVRAMARRTPWHSACLCQALAGAAMLRRRKLPLTLSLGVAKQSASLQDLSAHAWLRHGDLILTGAGGYEQFTVVSTFGVEK